MKWLFFIFTFLIVCSCIDFDRTQYLEDIDVFTEELNQSYTSLNDAHFDSIPIVLSEINRVNSRIRSYLNQDTISLEVALKIDDYKRIKSDLTQLTQQIPIARKDIKTVLSDLKNLKKDITNNTGDRANYGTHLALEKKNKTVLLKAIQHYSSVYDRSLKMFHSIHTSLLNYSIQLKMKNKEQNLIL